MSYVKYSALKELSADKKLIVRCPFDGCGSRIISLGSRDEVSPIHVENSPELLSTKSLAEYDEQKSTDSEIIPTDFYQIGDAWDFDNISVSKPTEIKNVPKLNHHEIDIERYLICADCGRGPFGFAGFLEKSDSNEIKNLTYFLSCDSVLYQTL